MFIIPLLILIIELINAFYYPYTSNFKITLKKPNYNPAINFMNLNEILNLNKKINQLNISFFNNNKSILFNYNTYSELDDYKYYHKYLLINNNFYIAKYSFKIDYNIYSYLIIIKSNNINYNKFEWNINVKYNYIFINKIQNDKIIIKYIKKCIYKKSNIINPLLSQYFNINN